MSTNWLLSGVDGVSGRDTARLYVGARHKIAPLGLVHRELTRVGQAQVGTGVAAVPEAHRVAPEELSTTKLPLACMTATEPLGRCLKPTRRSLTSCTRRGCRHLA